MVSDKEYVRRAQAVIHMEEHAGWADLMAMIEEKRTEIMEILCTSDPVRAIPIAKFQGRLEGLTEMRNIVGTLKEELRAASEQ